MLGCLDVGGGGVVRVRLFRMGGTRLWMGGILPLKGDGTLLRSILVGSMVQTMHLLLLHLLNLRFKSLDWTDYEDRLIQVSDPTWDVRVMKVYPVLQRTKHPVSAGHTKHSDAHHKTVLAVHPTTT